MRCTFIPALFIMHNTPTDSHTTFRAPFFFWKPRVFVLVSSSGAGGAVIVCCDGKLRAELVLMAAAERSEGWFYGWSQVFFLRFKGLCERPVSVHCCIHWVVVFSSFDSGSVYLCGVKTAEWLKWCDKSSENKNAAAEDVYMTIDSVREAEIYGWLRCVWGELRFYSEMFHKL